MKKIRPVCEHGESDRRWEHMLIPDRAKYVGGVVESMRKLIPSHVPAPLPPVVISARDLQLKKLKVHLDMSRETTCFSAEVWRKGQLIGYAENTGDGGSTMFTPAKTRGELDEADEWARALPPESSYNRLYRAMLICDADHRAVEAESMKSACWFTSDSLNLEHLVEAIVATEADKKAIKALGSYVVVGPKIGQADGCPNLLKYSKVLTPSQVVAAQATLVPPYSWAYMLRDAYELPFHYYPSPHPFSGLSWPRHQVVVNGRQFEVQHGTNDHDVVIGFEEGDPLHVEPHRVKFAEEPTSAAQALVDLHAANALKQWPDLLAHTDLDEPYVPDAEELAEMAEADRRMAACQHANIDPEDGCQDCGDNAK